MSNITTCNIPRSYLKKRRTSVFIFFTSIYLLGIYSYLTKDSVYEFDLTNKPFLLFCIITLFSELSLFFMMNAKCYYRGTRVYNADRVKVFSWKSWIAMILPILPAIYFNPTAMVGYLTATIFVFMVARMDTSSYGPSSLGIYCGSFRTSRKKKKPRMKLKREL